MSLSAEHQRILLDIAWRSIQSGLQTNTPLNVEADSLPAPLTAPGASFVTLEQGSDLRGCIGSLEAYRSLASDVAHNAFSAAFKDPRFPPLQAAELSNLTLQISVLSAPVEVTFSGEQDLLQQLVPQLDGLILQEGQRRATFLPQVWEQLPTPEQFITHLKLKAGLPADYWSDRIRVQRYRVEKFS